MNRATHDFKPVTRVCNIADTQAIIEIFRDITVWLQHVLRHFGERSEPWASCLEINVMDKVYSLRDTISNLGGESYLENFAQLCQKGNSKAVNICEEGNRVYGSIGPLVAGDMERGLDFPRYVYMLAKRIRLADGKETTEPVTFIITEPWAAIAIIRHTTLRTIYFPKREHPNGRTVSKKKRLDAAQHHLWNKIGRDWSQHREIKWHDKNSCTTYRLNHRDVEIFTPKSLGWFLKSREI